MRTKRYWELIKQECDLFDLSEYYPEMRQEFDPRNFFEEDDAENGDQAYNGM